MKVPDKKLQSLAKKLYEIVKMVGADEYQQFQNILQNTLLLMKNQKDYFNFFSSNDILKIVCYIFSLKRSGNFLEGEKIFNNLHIVGTISTELNHPEDICDNCDGNGNEPCVYCENGRVECNECNGDGVKGCPDCGGRGTFSDGDVCDTCDGFGSVGCDNCDGDGFYFCGVCGGNGDIQCDVCGGDGEVQDFSSYECEINYYLAWNSQIIDLCEIREKTPYPIGNDVTGDALPMAWIKNDKEKSQVDLTVVKKDEIYCFTLGRLGENATVKFDLNTGLVLRMVEVETLRPLKAELSNYIYTE